MPITMFRVSQYRTLKPTITEHKVKRISDPFVWAIGSDGNIVKEKRFSDGHCWFTEQGEAIMWLIGRVDSEVDSTHSKLLAWMRLKTRLVDKAGDG